MKTLLTDRRFLISLISIVLLFVLGWRGMAVADSIAMVAIGIGIANGGESALKAFASRGSKPADTKKE